MSFDMIGPALALALGCLGSAIGCGIAGMASHGVMSRVEENHAKFIAMSALPSSQAIYAIVLTIVMSTAIKAGTLSAASGIGIGASVGAANMVCSIYQGMAAATGIQASAKQPSVYGKCYGALGIIESFSIFAFIFALQLI